jgi:Holliday junction resolvase
MTGGKAPRARGDRFERACVIRLRTAGYEVIRSAGSLGPADIWAARGDRVLIWVQCKVTDTTTRAERVAYRTRANDAGALAVIASKRGRMTVWHIITDGGQRNAYELG